MGSIRQRGFTLIEMVMAMVIISIAVAGILRVMDFTTARSADPMVQAQAVAVAEAYLEDILSKSYNDPDGTDGEALRTAYDDVDDFHGLSDSGAVDSNGNPIASLADYSVTVAVTTETLSGVQLKRADVTVQHSSGLSIQVSGYRGNY